MWQWVARGNIHQISYISQTEQHSPFGLMLLHLGNVTTYYLYVCMYVCIYDGMYICVCVCVYVCMCVCMCVCVRVCVYVCMYVSSYAHL